MVQAELYNLTCVGGPRYVPRSVNTAAFRVLDALFPMGQRSRRLVSFLFRLWFHPTEWPRQAFGATSLVLRSRPTRFAYRCTSLLGKHRTYVCICVSIYLLSDELKVIPSPERL